MRALLLLLLLPASAAAQQITPAFTQGMTATTTTSSTVEEVIAHEVLEQQSRNTAVKMSAPSTNITDENATWSVTTAGDPWTLEITERSAGIIETIDIDRTIDIESTTTSLSVFSQ